MHNSPERLDPELDLELLLVWALHQEAEALASDHHARPRT